MQLETKNKMIYHSYLSLTLFCVNIVAKQLQDGVISMKCEKC